MKVATDHWASNAARRADDSFPILWRSAQAAAGWLEGTALEATVRLSVGVPPAPGCSAENPTGGGAGTRWLQADAVLETDACAVPSVVYRRWPGRGAAAADDGRVRALEIPVSLRREQRREAPGCSRCSPVYLRPCTCRFPGCGTHGLHGDCSRSAHLQGALSGMGVPVSTIGLGAPGRRA